MEAELDKTIRQSQVKWEICIGRSVVAINIASISFFGDLLCESAQKTWEKIKDFSFTSFWKNQNLIAGLNAVKSSLCSAPTHERVVAMGIFSIDDTSKCEPMATNLLQKA